MIATLGIQQGISRRAFFPLTGLSLFSQSAAPRKRIAALVSEYRPGSHADAIVGKVLNGYYYNGEERSSTLQVVSMYTDQVPDEDMSRDLAAQHKFRLLPTIRETLTMVSNHSAGARKLAVDAVLLICEHGAYPYNAAGQKLYPRYEFFKQVVDVFRETGQTVPVFCDKHLSYDWHKARWMYDQSRELSFPLMAGSVQPLVQDAKAKIPLGTPLEREVFTWRGEFFDSKDAYGFHAIETLQSLVERRSHKESGVSAVQCFERDPVWQWTDEHPWAVRLLGSLTGADFVRSRVKVPLLFVVHYRDGLQAALYRLNAYPNARMFAALRRGSTEIFQTPPGPEYSNSRVSVPEALRRKYPYNHFSAVVNNFENLMTGRPPATPVERTLLTSGVLTALFDSSYVGGSNYGKTLQHGTLLELGRRIETPHLAISYDVC